VSRFFAPFAALFVAVAILGSSAQACAGQIGGRHIFAGANKHDCPTWPTGTGILKDGDFHRQVNPGRGYYEYWRGSVFAAGWQPVKRGSIDFNGSTGWGSQPPNGVCTIDMDGLSAGTIRTKPFATTPSAGYTATFILSGNGFCPPQIKGLRISATGQSQEYTWDISGGNDASNGVWVAETWGFTAVSTSTSLTVQSLDPKQSHCGPVVGAFAVTPD